MKISPKIYYPLSLIVNRLINLVKFIILARILNEYDMGQVAIILIFLAMMEVITDFGISNAIMILSNTKFQMYRIELHRFSILRGLFLSVLSILFYLIASYLDKSYSAAIYLIACVIPLIRGIYAVPMAVFSRNVELKKISSTNIISSALDAAICAVGIIVTNDIIFVAIGMISGEIVKILLSGAKLPIGILSKISDEAKSLIREHGSWIWTTNVINLIINQGDKIFIGAVLGVAPLGAYQIMSKLAVYVAYEPLSFISQAMGPIFSKNYRSEASKNKNYPMFIKIISFSFLFSLLTILLFNLCFDAVVKISIGDQWLKYKSLAIVLCAVSLVSVLITICGTYLKSIGESKNLGISTGLQLVIYIFMLPTLYYSAGVIGIAIAGLVAGGASLMYILFKILSSSRYS
ncbi:hypothetical protein GCM10017784_20300 [Deinococcus indicus]|uniref:oligosaccharide flippase family protein n=1 Tax=Deinococcus indicus TaxID=223556 RepID=UPI0019877CA3|nr:oligosaccharide flippase family protein [Deinococcus indicus]GHG27621.1 hypothetical protein GCM10017784_20300 [Deinococcus indicus]